MRVVQYRFAIVLNIVDIGIYLQMHKALWYRETRMDWIKVKLQTIQTRVKRYRTTLSNRVQQVDSFRQTLSRQYYNHSVRIEIISLVRHRARSSKQQAASSKQLLVENGKNDIEQEVYIFFSCKHISCSGLRLPLFAFLPQLCSFLCVRSHFNGYLIVYYIYNIDGRKRKSMAAAQLVIVAARRMFE